MDVSLEDHPLWPFVACMCDDLQMEHGDCQKPHG